VVDYYRGLGFFKVTVARQTSYDPRHGKLLVTYFVNEGQRYTISKVVFDGNSALPSETLARTVRLTAGEPFDRTTVDADMAAIKSLYGGRGFVFADASAELRFNDEPGTVDAIYRLTEGDVYRVAR
jgi:outer membrane protein insertion porin family